MTNDEGELIAALKADIHTGKTEARFFDTLVEHVSGGQPKTGPRILAACASGSKNIKS